MDSNRINGLLEKYWNAETSLEEEQELQHYFESNTVPENLRETAELFRFFRRERERTMENFSVEDVTNNPTARQGGKIVSMKNSFRIARIAAGILVIVAAVYLVGQELRRSSPKTVADTESDPKLAFEETKKALLMISRSFNKAQREASRINLLNEAEQKVQGKATSDKTVADSHDKKDSI